MMQTCMLVGYCLAIKSLNSCMKWNGWGDNGMAVSNILQIYKLHSSNEIPFPFWVMLLHPLLAASELTNYLLLGMHLVGCIQV